MRWQKLAAQQALGFDGGDGILFDDFVGRPVEIHDDHDLVVRAMRQQDGSHRATVDPAHAHIAACIQSRHVCELRL